MLIREILIAAVTVALALAGARRIDVLWAGKAGTLALMFSLPMFLGADATTGAWHAFFVVGSWGFAIGGVILGYYAAWQLRPGSARGTTRGPGMHELGWRLAHEGSDPGRR